MAPDSYNSPGWTSFAILDLTKAETSSHLDRHRLHELKTRGETVTIKNFLSLCLIAILFALMTAQVAAQSLNTATMVVNVVDQNNAVVKDAKVSVTNTATGDVREV